MKKLRWKPEYGEPLQIIVGALLVCALMLPLFRQAQYAHPALDDFVTPWLLRTRHMQPGDSWLAGAVRFAADYFMNKQGWYTASFFQALNPYHIVGIWAVPYVSMLALALFLGAFLLFLRALLVNVFGCRAWSVTVWFFTATVFLVTQFSNPGAIFFFYTNSSGYLLPFLFMLCGFATLLYALRAGARPARVVLAVLSCICFFWACGGQFMIGCTASVVLAALCVGSFLRKWNRRWLVLAAAAVTVLFTALVILAPGNNVRHETYGNVESLFSRLVWWLVQSVRTGVGIYTEDAALPWKAAALLLLVFPARKAVASCGFTFRFPLLPIAFSGAILLGALYIYEFAVSTVDIPEKQIILMNMLAILLMLFCAVYGLGWLIKVKGLSLKGIAAKTAIAVAAAMMAVVAFGRAPVREWVSVAVARDLGNGVIQAYRQEADDFLAAFESPEKDLVFTRPTPAYPYFYGFGQLDNPEHFDYRSVTRPFGKDSITFKLEEEKD